MRGASGQASVLLVGLLAVVLLGALVLGAVARGVGVQGEQQHAADLAALAGARALRDAHDRLYLPADGSAGPPLSVASYLALGREAAVATARRNGAEDVLVAYPGAQDGLAPTRIRVTVRDAVGVGEEEVPAGAVAEAELRVASLDLGGPVNSGEYPGPFETRQGQRMRPDVALAFDRLAAAARREVGVGLVIASAFRSDAEQAVLFAAHPDPKWVAPPGKSLHRLGTELDLGPPAAYAWLARRGTAFGFLRRYPWEPWHFGFTRAAASAKLGYASSYDPERHTTLPSFVPARYVEALTRAAQRWNVSASLLAAQLQQESGFNPNARSPVGAQGIAQFMPGTAAAYGLRDPFDAEAAIDAQGHLMHDLLRQFGAVPLALAAYNAGPAPVGRCGCVPGIPETQAYVAAILALLRGAGAPAAGDPGGLEVRLVR